MSFGLASTPFGEWVAQNLVGARELPDVVPIPPGLLGSGQKQCISLVPQGLLAELHVFPDHPEHAAVVKAYELRWSTDERELIARQKIEDEFR